MHSSVQVALVRDACTILHAYDTVEWNEVNARIDMGR